ncbi:alpha/beta hydrolase [Tamilnaduibacter salinus]|uniref:Alpha/beta hydrolase n=1 Tax=Tamilnaduibacter salinus TaxID=1484056 RepID=A0A2A2I799_9GAMM|nr:alpha/beta fold hydrolase [Tamilnaduibacter salinus]PAV26985.1 alpha/beta hydrolase [Tamilnaduibacter salinus]
MSIIEPQPDPVAHAGSDYRPPVWLRNGHLQSIWPTLFRRVTLFEPQSDVVATPDDDRLHMDWYRAGNRRLAILSHGLEGHSRRPYMLGLARALLAGGWDVLAWNFRSCGGRMNHQPRFYHSGATEDLDCVVRRALADPAGYEQLALAGFSMGGNLTMLYLAEQGSGLDERITHGLGFSVPCDLAGSAAVLALPSRRIYMNRFLKDLGRKMAHKASAFPDRISVTGFDRIRTFREFDDRYTAPLHGFRDAEAYWARCSCLGRLNDIAVPSLILNAEDDPFLSRECYPADPEVLGRQVRLEAPPWGGHVGFVDRDPDGYYWSERRAVAFLSEDA